MKLKTMATALLLSFVLASVAYLLIQETRRPARTSGAIKSPDTLSDPTPPAHQVVAYYFHGQYRCPNCLKIEAYTREAIQTGFSPELKNGSLEWRVVNVDEPENRHFIQDYQLYTKSVILSDLHHGRQARWKNLDQVWTFLPDQAAFMKYVRDEVRAYVTAD